MADTPDLDLTVRAVTPLAEGIAAFELAAGDGALLPPFTAGSHVTVHLPNGLERQYSLCNAPWERHRYVIAVHAAPNSRGGSLVMHRDIGPGTVLRTSRPKNFFGLQENAGSLLFIAGGIGITPIRSMIARAETLGLPWRLVYATRTPELTAFRDEATGAWRDRCHLHHSGEANERLLDLSAWLASPAPETHLYCCGPTPMMQAVAAGTRHWPDDHVHFEWFGPAPGDAAGGDAFEVEIASTGEILPVASGQSVLEALREAGIDCESSCEEGTCGTCATRVLAGDPDHRDSIVPGDADLRAQGIMMLCVSRARSPRLVLDL